MPGVNGREVARKKCVCVCPGRDRCGRKTRIASAHEDQFARKLAVSGKAYDGATEGTVAFLPLAGAGAGRSQNREPRGSPNAEEGTEIGYGRQGIQGHVEAGERQQKIERYDENRALSLRASRR